MHQAGSRRPFSHLMLSLLFETHVFWNLMFESYVAQPLMTALYGPRPSVRASMGPFQCEMCLGKRSQSDLNQMCVLSIQPCSRQDKYPQFSVEPAQIVKPVSPTRRCDHVLCLHHADVPHAWLETCTRRGPWNVVSCCPAEVQTQSTLEGNPHL